MATIRTQSMFRPVQASDPTGSSFGFQAQPISFFSQPTDSSAVVAETNTKIRP